MIKTGCTPTLQFPVKEKQKTYKFLVAHHGLEAPQK